MLRFLKPTNHTGSKYVKVITNLSKSNYYTTQWFIYKYVYN